jgi:acyl carrier protein
MCRGIAAQFHPLTHPIEDRRASMQVKDEVRQYILKNYLFSTDASALGDEVSLMQTGIIDSTGILELIMFLQEKFGIEVADEEMIPENLDSVEKIVAFVARKS